MIYVLIIFGDFSLLGVGRMGIGSYMYLHINRISVGDVEILFD